ncbi:class IV adenylate cyclase [Methanosarcina sp. MSH10X1]|uniref:class IV adenylate cyclase n=1 Tax=Methanosarcina sp. MSH10X1 TaxID=2507075 RepID=UPI000FFCA4E8|nr:class IV adenylate cyclase [Methanosarcina sp. MSH10X1]RXA19019.1 class IV adenylate cyclase [Methanosarcina sp. MSH10X1]
MIEIEVKVKLDHSKASPVLKKIGAVKLGAESQSDIYFAAPYRDFARTDEALRIRSLDGEAVLTYKGPKLDRVSKTRKEFETSVDEAATIEILHALGFSEAGVVRKKREVFTAGEITVCLDVVEGLGEFLEVEIVAENENELETSRAKLFELLKQFGAGEKDSIRTSYLEMVLEKDKS